LHTQYAEASREFMVNATHDIGDEIATLDGLVDEIESFDPTIRDESQAQRIIENIRKQETLTDAEKLVVHLADQLALMQQQLDALTGGSGKNKVEVEHEELGSEEDSTPEEDAEQKPGRLRRLANNIDARIEAGPLADVLPRVTMAGRLEQRQRLGITSAIEEGLGRPVADLVAIIDNPEARSGRVIDRYSILLPILKLIQEFNILDMDIQLSDKVSGLVDDYADDVVMNQFKRALEVKDKKGGFTRLDHVSLWLRTKRANILRLPELNNAPVRPDSPLAAPTKPDTAPTTTPLGSPDAGASNPDSKPATAPESGEALEKKNQQKLAELYRTVKAEFNAMADDDARTNSVAAIAETKRSNVLNTAITVFTYIVEGKNQNAEMKPAEYADRLRLLILAAENQAFYTSLLPAPSASKDSMKALVDKIAGRAAY
jgi:hypothetical protein